MNIASKIMQPVPALEPYVERVWMLANNTNEAKPIVLLPDGSIDVLFSYADDEPYNVMLMGLGSEPGPTAIAPAMVIFGISFKLLAVEYLLHTKMGGLVNEARNLPLDFWGTSKSDLNDFDGFCEKVTAKMLDLIPADPDSRKLKLFELIYATKGAITVKELSERSYWSSRQMNRYFTNQFGLSLKAYCNILRFYSSLQQIKEGRFFPEENFADQAHFIKEIKKFAGVAPKELYKNKDDRFIQFATLPGK